MAGKDGWLAGSIELFPFKYVHVLWLTQLLYNTAKGLVSFSFLIIPTTGFLLDSRSALEEEPS